MQHVLINHVQQSATSESHVLVVFDEMPTPRPTKYKAIFDQLFYVFIVVYLWYFIVMDMSIHFDQKLYIFSELRGYFRHFLCIQLDSQPSRQTLKLRTTAFPRQQLSLHSSFPCTASHRQPKQTGL
jgi:hypothetical protein